MSSMEQKQQFVSLVGSGRFTITELCLEFKISRKTGHKWLLRHEEDGVAGLEDRSRAPKCSAGRTPDDVERLIVTERRLHPTWGPKKIRGLLIKIHGIERPPRESTIALVLSRHGLSQRRKRKIGVHRVRPNEE